MTDAARLTRVFLKIREAKRQLTADFNAKEKALDEQLELVGNHLLKFLTDTGQKSAKTDDGVFYRQKEIKPAGADWGAFYKWIVEQDAFEFLEKRIKKTEIAKYMKENKGAIPPGVTVFETFVVRVRKASEQGDDNEELGE